ncbi:MAG TPA: hypothetical protein VKT29_14470 [Terriglobales bacterium]|nr:hypothetical protein [Terriglobales bacterium]
MIRILSVSYDVSLLNSRQLLLESKGYEVVSVAKFDEALRQCERDARFDVFILGHSIPRGQKDTLVMAFRAHSSAPVIGLTRRGEDPTPLADVQTDPDPAQLLSAIANILASKAASA